MSGDNGLGVSKLQEELREVGRCVTVGFGSVYRKKKMEEEEAEVKRKATDAAYQGKLEMSCFTPPQREMRMFLGTFGKYLSPVKTCSGRIP